MDTFFKWYFLTVGALFIISFFLKKLECTKEDVLVEELVDTVRGEGGFGSTGA